MHLVAVVFGWSLILLFQYTWDLHPRVLRNMVWLIHRKCLMVSGSVGCHFTLWDRLICILQFLQQIMISELSPGTFITNAHTSLARADRLQLWCQLQNCGELEERASSAASLEPRNSWLELCCYLKKALNSQSSHWGTLGRNLQRFRGI